jgi:4,5-DOPA dioxygenase extradiol
VTTFPTLFISHGAPDLVLGETPAREFLSCFGNELCKECGRPEAILIVSAHFDTKVPSLSADETFMVLMTAYIGLSIQLPACRS